MGNGMIQLKYDYKLFGKNSTLVRDGVNEIHGLCKSTVQNIVRIGEVLHGIKSVAEHGQFIELVETEFGWPYKKCNQYMKISERFGKCPDIGTFDYSSMLVLAQDSTPDEAIAEAISRADHGEEITHKVAKEIVAKHKEPDTLPMKQSIPVHAELVEEDDDVAAVQSILRGEHKDKYETRQDDEPAATRTFKTDAEILIEKVQKLINEVDRMASERMGHNAKSRAVVNHFNDSIPLIKSMAKSWRN